jgi:hypothetical protein
MRLRWFWQRFEGLTRNSDWEVILVGDFNRLWPKEGALTSVLLKKCANHGITNPAAAALRSRGVPYLSFCNKEGDIKNGLGHVLATLPPESLRGAGILSGPSWTARADHAPIWGGYCIPRRQQPVEPIWECTERRLQVAIDKRLYETLEELKSKTLDWLSTAPASPFPLTLEERDSRLEELQTGLRVTAESALLRSKKKHAPGWYFFGAFPVPLRLLKMHLHTLVRLRRLLKAPLLRRSYRTGSLRGPRLRRYLYIVTAWRDYAPGLHGDMLEPDRLLNPLDAGTSRGPDWWFSARSAKKIRGNLALDIRTLNARYKRKYRSLCSASIKDQVLKRQEQLLNGRMRIALASLLGKRKSSFLFDTLLCVDGSHDADPVSIHRTIQSHFMRYFSAVPENLL